MLDSGNLNRNRLCKFFLTHLYFGFTIKTLKVEFLKGTSVQTGPENPEIRFQIGCRNVKIELRKINVIAAQARGKYEHSS